MAGGGETATRHRAWAAVDAGEGGGTQGGRKLLTIPSHPPALSAWAVAGVARPRGGSRTWRRSGAPRPPPEGRLADVVHRGGGEPPRRLPDARPPRRHRQPMPTATASRHRLACWHWPPTASGCARRCGRVTPTAQTPRGRGGPHRTWPFGPVRARTSEPPPRDGGGVQRVFGNAGESAGGRATGTTPPRKAQAGRHRRAQGAATLSIPPSTAPSAPSPNTHVPHSARTGRGRLALRTSLPTRPWRPTENPQSHSGRRHPPDGGPGATLATIFTCSRGCPTDAAPRRQRP